MAEPQHNEKQRTSLRALIPLIPYARRYKGRILAAIAALTAAAGATLTVPLAVKGMIDHGFSAESTGAINWYFGAMVGVVGILALASATRYFLVMTIGERIVADLRADLFAHQIGR